MKWNNSNHAVVTHLFQHYVAFLGLFALKQSPLCLLRVERLSVSEARQRQLGGSAFHRRIATS